MALAGNIGAGTPDEVQMRLAIDPVEAETVRLIFKLYLEGEGASDLWASRRLPRP
jgi:hypothetical protein